MATAFQMPYPDDRTANTFANSVWRLADFNVNFLRQSVRIVFAGFVNAAAATALKNTIGIHEYNLTTAEWAAFVANITTSPKNVHQSCLDYAAAKIDSAPDVNGIPTASFFAGATQV